MLNVEREMEFDEPFLVEGLPGVGLVGKLVVDLLERELDLERYGYFDCDGLSHVAVFEDGEYDVNPPVRLLANQSRDLVVLQSDIPVAPDIGCFVDCVTEWIDDEDVLPLYLSGLPVGREADDEPSLYGVATGDSTHLLEEHDVEPPQEGGIMSGPTGALLERTWREEFDGVGLIAETHPNFPDPEAAYHVVEEFVAPATGIDVDTTKLVEQSEQIMEQREALAKRMQEAQEESTTVTPTGMYQ